MRLSKGLPDVKYVSRQWLEENRGDEQRRVDSGGVRCGGSVLPTAKIRVLDGAMAVVEDRCRVAASVGKPRR